MIVFWLKINRLGLKMGSMFALVVHGPVLQTLLREHKKPVLIAGSNKELLTQILHGFAPITRVRTLLERMQLHSVCLLVLVNWSQVMAWTKVVRPFLWILQRIKVSKLFRLNWP
ncbi:MAG: hypothetical protein CMO80_21840 [Verrucomicrobiales bacterium]|nr:hypothetical protein [Verrucomicrobiales bacterium]